MILDSASKIRVDSRGPRKTKRKQSTTISEGKDIVYTCGACSRKTKQHMRYRALRNEQKQIPKEVILPATISPKTTSSRELPSSNASSKKRAKARKRGGLEAILAKKRASESQNSSAQLGLMDLMKKG